MKKVLISTALISCMLFAAIAGAAAEDLVGKWTGKANASGIEANGTVQFMADGTFTAGALGLEARGTYAYDGGDTMTITPSFPPGYGTLTLDVTWEGETLIVSGVVDNLQASVRIQRTGDVDTDANAQASEGFSLLKALKKLFTGQ